jgi:hypothetical protein
MDGAGSRFRMVPLLVPVGIVLAGDTASLVDVGPPWIGIETSVDPDPFPSA